MSPFQSSCGRVAGGDPCQSPGAWTGHKLAARDPEAQDLLGRSGTTIQGMPPSACIRQTLHGYQGFAEPGVDDSA